MYKISRSASSVTIRNWNDEVVYNADLDSYIVYRPENKTEVRVERVKDMPDEKLLRALATSSKLALTLGGK